MALYPEQPPIEQTRFLPEIVVDQEQSETFLSRTLALGHSALRTVVELTGTAAKGFLMGVPATLKEYVGTIKQTAVDVKQINKLEAARQAEIIASNVPETMLAKFKRRLGKVAMAGWYATAVPAYQLFDDALTYPLFLNLQHSHGTPGAYGIAATAGFGLAVATATTQRTVEKSKAKLIDEKTTQDDSPWFRRILDSSVNSSMWQVMLAANKPRESGEAVPIVGMSRISQYAAAYALVNTGVYVVADSLPVGEWTGFGLSLAMVWSIGNAYEEVKRQLNGSKLETT